MNPTAQAALDRARRRPPAPAPIPAPAPVPTYSTEPVYCPRPIPVLVVQGPINHFMRLQARAEATATVFAMRDTLRAANGLALVVEQLKRTAEGRPASHIAGYLDIIQLLEQGQ